MSKAVVIGSVISGIIGLGIGIGGTYIYFKKVYDVNTDKEYQEYKRQLDEDRETIKNLQAQVANKLALVKEDMLKSGMEEGTVPVIVSDNLTIDDIIAESEEPEAEINEDIRFISPKDYDDDDEYEKEFIKYYSVDNVISQDDDILSDEEFTEVCGGRIVLQSFGKFDAPSSEIYVRNEHFRTDYKIKKYNISYERYINSLK
jgi:hypothetical protein